jgi:hypothetical protein
MAQLSIVARDMSEESRAIGFDTPASRGDRWALWGVLFDAFIFIPSIGQVAIDGYLRPSPHRATLPFT